MIYIGNKRQGSVEFLFLISIYLILILSLANFLAQDNDLNLAISTVKNGINVGKPDEEKLTVYDGDAYDKYITENILLTPPNLIKIVII